MNTLFGFGSNGSGQLGLGHLKDVNIPQRCIGIPSNERIKKVVGGGNHSAVLTSSGRLFMAGSSQLGSRQQKIWEKEQPSDERSATLPYDWTRYNECYSQHKWQDVACGWAFTILVNDKGNVYGVGSSSFGELGVVSKEDVTDLRAIDPDLLVNVDSVACGWRHCVALDRTGSKVYGWGWGKHGQLGIQHIDGKPSSIFPPCLVGLPEHITRVACGHLHTIFMGKGGLYGCGVNKNGQVGSMGISKVLLPTLVHDGSGGDRHEWQLTTGWHHSALLTDGGELLMWGKNDHGQVQNGLRRVVRVVSGSEHVLAQLDSGDIVAWGWNEHGNCTTDDDKVLVPLVVRLPQDGKVTLLGAGCATSWIGLSDL
ncbi:regulator of chromosome condensation 1/beta-lactamase-inhibitor protein II [Chlamydoabsidia padenii]|nr:regulator of chromosome condensation 1/beta-lactamase-inhibitor protein II [Chlamydoabsidia padenii]